MIRTTKSGTMSLCAAISIALAAAAGCSTDSTNGEGDISSRPSTALPSQEVQRIWEAYSACPEGCELTQEDADTLDAFNLFAQSSPALSPDSRAILETLRQEMEAAGYHPSQILNVVHSLPSYSDPRTHNLFTSGEVCNLLDEYDGNPPGTTPCVPGETAYWSEPASKTTAGVAAATVILGALHCVVHRYDCMSATANAFTNAAGQCDSRTEFLDMACANGIRANHEARCRPCGKNFPTIADYKPCCRRLEN